MSLFPATAVRSSVCRYDLFDSLEDVVGSEGVQRLTHRMPTICERIAADLGADHET